MSAANSAARNHQAAEKSPEARTGQSGPSENGSAGGGRRPRSGIDGRTTDKKSADRKQSAGTGAKAAEPANASGAQEMETWVQDTAESELAIDGLDHPADLDAVVDIAVVGICAPLNRTRVPGPKFVPVTVMVWPAPTLAGVAPVIVGKTAVGPCAGDTVPAGTDCTFKIASGVTLYPNEVRRFVASD